MRATTAAAATAVVANQCLDRRTPCWTRAERVTKATSMTWSTADIARWTGTSMGCSLLGRSCRTSGASLAGRTRWNSANDSDCYLSFIEGERPTGDITGRYGQEGVGGGTSRARGTVTPPVGRWMVVVRPP